MIDISSYDLQKMIDDYSRAEAQDVAESQRIIAKRGGRKSTRPSYAEPNPVPQGEDLPYLPIFENIEREPWRQTFPITPPSEVVPGAPEPWEPTLPPYQPKPPLGVTGLEDLPRSYRPPRTYQPVTQAEQEAITGWEDITRRQEQADTVTSALTAPPTFDDEGNMVTRGGALYQVGGSDELIHAVMNAKPGDYLWDHGIPLLKEAADAADDMLDNERADTIAALDQANKNRDFAEKQRQSDRLYALDVEKYNLSVAKAEIAHMEFLAKEARLQGGGRGGGGRGGGGRGGGWGRGGGITELEQQRLAYEAAQQAVPPGEEWKYWRPVPGAKPMTEYERQIMGLRGAELEKRPEHWIGRWQQTHKGQLPSAPEWLAFLTSLTSGQPIAASEVTIPSTEFWMDLTPDERIQFLAYIGWTGGSAEDITARIKALAPPQGATPWLKWGQR